MLRSRNALNRRLDEQAREIERNRAEREAAAVLGERTRIARELHDVVAHDVSVMLVQAAAAKRTVPADPERARAAIAAVEETGREALGELRRLLGVLRRGDEELALAPQPSLERIGALVERMRAAGLPVELEVAGEPVHLPPGRRRRRLSHRPGGARQRHAPRGRHARARARRLRAGGRRARGQRRRPRRGGRSTTAAGSSTCASASRSTAASCAPGRLRPRGFELRARLPVGEPAT